MLNKGHVFIVVSPIPNVLSGVPNSKMQISMQATAEPLKFFREHTMGNKTQWTIVAASNQSWASKLFPTLDPKIAEENYWDAIFNACRVSFVMIQLNHGNVIINI